MNNVMLTFGAIAFDVSGATYQALRRATRFRVAALEHIGKRPGYQFTGRGEESITLSGVIMPTYRGRPAILDDLRALAATGEPQILAAGTGEAFGRWFLDDLNEEQSGLFADGQARKVAFTVKLLRDDDEESGRLARLRQDAAAVGDVASITDAMQAAVDRGEDSEGVIAAAQGAIPA